MDNNVVNINASKKGKRPQKSMSDVYREISDIMNGADWLPYPAFPTRFHIVEPSPGARLIVQEGRDQVVSYVPEARVVQEIHQYVHQRYMIMAEDKKNFEHRNAIECMRFWRDITTSIPEPRMISWPHDEGYTFRRLPWAMEEGETPLFDEIFRRMTNGTAFKVFVGSLFFEQADLQQYVWIYSEGQTGKGVLSRFLRRAIKGAYSSQTTPTPNDKFWTSGLLGSRLVVFPDCNNRSFAASGLFKSLTGGDPIKMEQKGRQPFTAELKAKYMFLSNERPALSSEKADMRRAIFCEMGPIPPDKKMGPDYEERIWTEGGRFLAECVRTYHEWCPNHGPLIFKYPDEELDNWIGTVEEEFETKAVRYFNISKGLECAPIDFNEQLYRMWPRDRARHNEFRAWLERKHGIRRRSKRVGATVIKIYNDIETIKFPDVT